MYFSSWNFAIYAQLMDFAAELNGWFMTIGQIGQYTWSGSFAPIVGEVQRAAGRSLEKGNVSFPLQTVVFKEEGSQSYITYKNRLDHFLEYSRNCTRNLAHSGLISRIYLLRDLTNPERPSVKITYSHPRPPSWKRRCGGSKEIFSETATF